jgi:hypothetical protein
MYSLALLALIIVIIAMVLLMSMNGIVQMAALCSYATNANLPRDFLRSSN